jgi:hypothetical protein
VSEPYAIQIGGVTVPWQCHCKGLSVDVERHASGRLRVSLKASGFYPPALSGVDWSAPVTITWADLGTDGGYASLSVLSTGVQRSDDVLGVVAGWSLIGVAAGSHAGLATIGGSTYWCSVDARPLAGPIQRMSTGAGVLMRPWSKQAVTIRGETGGSAPAVSGAVAVTSEAFTGTLLTQGVAKSWDPETGLLTWTLEGEEQ